MTFTIIGTGNIAWFIGNRLVAARHHCNGVFGRNDAQVKKFAEALLCNKHGDISAARDTEADVCFIAVADDAIAEVASRLSYKKTVLVHTAGAIGLDVLKNASTDTAVLWPVYSITSSSIPQHRNIPMAWEASSVKAEKYALSLAHALTDVLFEAKYEQRRWLHLSAVISNNFVNHLMAISERICQENDIPFSALLPVIDQTFARFRQSSPSVVQTGPAIRGDQKTITEQASLLSTHPEWQAVYQAITNSIIHTHASKDVA
jgi:predicted short-subunit dehydrogenase-like oxidoreductase (DUF2520 family)